MQFGCAIHLRLVSYSVVLCMPRLDPIKLVLAMCLLLQVADAKVSLTNFIAMLLQSDQKPYSVNPIRYYSPVLAEK
ncbi:MAG: hypothetical protein ACJA11_002307 [Glaciecola sp.]|jgi:hypothetical protein